MANVILYQDTTESQARAQEVTRSMLMGMTEALNDLACEKQARNIIPRSRLTDEQGIRRDMLRLFGMIRQLRQYRGIKGLRINGRIKSLTGQFRSLKAMLRHTDTRPHRAIMIPQTQLELPFGIIEHLGEVKQPKPFLVKGQRHMVGGTGLTNLEKIIYHEAGMTAQGDAVLPHENRSKAHWSKDASQIRAKFRAVGCTAEQAEDIKRAFAIIGLPPAELDKKKTPHSSTPADWVRVMQVSPDKFRAGLYWIFNLAAELDAVAPEENEILDMAEELADEVRRDEAEEIAPDRTSWHLLDDPRDLLFTELPERPRTIFSNERAEIQSFIDAVHAAKSYDELAAIGKVTFQKDWEKPGLFWDVYKRRKLEFYALNDTAKAAINRLNGHEMVNGRWVYTGNAANLAKAAAWLHSGKTGLNKAQLNQVWMVWKARKAETRPTA